MSKKEIVRTLIRRRFLDACRLKARPCYPANYWITLLPLPPPTSSVPRFRASRGKDRRPLYVRLSLFCSFSTSSSFDRSHRSYRGARPIAPGSWISLPRAEWTELLPYPEWIETTAERLVQRMFASRVIKSCWSNVSDNVGALHRSFASVHVCVCACMRERLFASVQRRLCRDFDALLSRIDCGGWPRAWAWRTTSDGSTRILPRFSWWIGGVGSCVYVDRGDWHG